MYVDRSLRQEFMISLSSKCTRAQIDTTPTFKKLYPQVVFRDAYMHGDRIVEKLGLIGFCS